MSSRALSWLRTSLAKHPAARPNDFSPTRLRSRHGGRQVAGFSASSSCNKEIGRRAKEKQLDREFFLSLLSSASTKREAKQYLSRFKNATKSASATEGSPKGSSSLPSPTGVNLGSFYGASRAVSESPVFRQDTTPAPKFEESPEQLHLALVNRISTAIDKQPDSKSFVLDSALTIPTKYPNLLEIESRKTILALLRDSHVLVVPPIAYTEESPKAVLVSADDAVLALTKEFAGLSIRPDPDEDAEVTAQRIFALQEEVSLDRNSTIFERSFSGKKDAFIGEKNTGNEDLETARSLLDNNTCIAPSTASGVITSPYEVANSSRQPHAASELSAVGTRRQRNPLIHNLLTDKPLLSSSLPPARRVNAISKLNQIETHTPHTTFIKRGMPLTLLPDPFVQAWSARNQPRLKLDHPSIDLPRLVHLIEDSFDRKLDVQNYLDRVNDRIAGLIVAGEYEGGAILTWETPPGVADDGSEESAARMVPYLDKFAVLKRSQGAGGVADIVFNAMVRTCFPNGVCWRSRKDNPVNKWYFERSAGTWKLSDSNWTMFWTTPNLPEDSRRFQDYEAVCRSIQPSWADNKSVVD
ncbi:hypothetical protein N7470_001145 [Penicillium chermesinum]|nr:hypothetical protein N7470_001145 [Penicillium chermesinum]